MAYQVLPDPRENPETKVTLVHVVQLDLRVYKASRGHRAHQVLREIRETSEPQEYQETRASKGHRDLQEYQVRNLQIHEQFSGSNIQHTKKLSYCFLSIKIIFRVLSPVSLTGTYETY